MLELPTQWSRVFICGEYCNLEICYKNFIVVFLKILLFRKLSDAISNRTLELHKKIGSKLMKHNNPNKLVLNQKMLIKLQPH